MAGLTVLPDRDTNARWGGGVKIAMSVKEESAFFSFGDWTVRPAQRSLERSKERVVIEPKLMDVLTYLAGTGGAVVSTEQLLIDCWRGTFYGDNPVHKAIALLRKALKDDAKAPRYISTVRKRGYQVVTDVAFADERIRGSPSTRSWTEGSPFRGLLPFETGHAVLFFGRARATAELLTALRAQRSSGCAFVLVTGPSGSGKSSLIHAGIASSLRREAGSGGIRAVAFASFAARPQGMAPHEALVVAMTQWEVFGRPIFLDTERQTLAKALLEDMPSVLDRIAYSLRSHTHKREGDGALLVVETLEALVATPAVPSLECSAFIQILAQLAQSGHVMILALCRNDFYPKLMEIPELLALKRGGGLYDVEMPTAGEIAQMIRLPALAAGLSFERDSTTERQLDDVLLESACRRPGVLPLLQYTLQALYELREANGLLTFTAYKKLGGLEGALAQQAENVFTRLDASAAEAFACILQSLVAVNSDGDEVTACSVRWRDLASVSQCQVVQHLVDAHLFVSFLEGDEPCFTVAHEALLGHWPRIANWVASHRAILRSRARIAEMTRRWLNEGRRQEHLLPRGLLLADALALYKNASPPMLGEQRLFVQRSVRGVRIRTTLLAAACTLVVVLALLSSLATLMARRAETYAEQRRADTDGLLDFMLGDLHERLDAVGRLDLLDAVTGRALAVLSHGKQTGEPGDVLRQVRALREIGEIRFTRGDLDSAIQAFTSADTRLHLMSARGLQRPDIYAELGKLDFWRGQVATRRNHPDEAHLAWLSYLADARQRAILEPLASDAWLELSYADNCLGTYALRSDRLDEAATYFSQSIALKQRVLSVHAKDHKTWLELADTLSWLALAEQQNGNLRPALNKLKAERQAVLKARESGAPSNLWRYRSALANLHVARAEADLGFALEAARDYSTATTQFTELVDEVPDNQSWQRDLAYALLQQGWLSYGMNHPSQAARHLSAAEERLQRLLATDPNVADWHILLALDHNYQSIVALRLGQTKKATALITTAWNDVATHDKAKITVANEVLKAMLEITSGEIASARGDRASMTAYLLDVIRSLQQHLLTSHDPRLLDPYVRASLLIGHRTDAIAYLQRLNDSGYRSPMFESSIKTSQPKD